MHVGQRIRARREQLGLSMVQLASAAKLDKGNLSRIERDGRGFSHESLMRLAGELKTSASDLLNSDLSVMNIGERKLPVWDYTTAPAFVYSSPTAKIENAGIEGKQRYVLTDQDYHEGTFALEITDDSMAPRLRRGMVAIIDPKRPIMPSAVVAVYFMDGATPMVALRSYRDRGYGTDGERKFEAAPENAAYRTLHSDDPGVRIVGVLAEHREYW